MAGSGALLLELQVRQGVAEFSQAAPAIGLVADRLMQDVHGGLLATFRYTYECQDAGSHLRFVCRTCGEPAAYASRLGEYADTGRLPRFRIQDFDQEEASRERDSLFAASRARVLMWQSMYSREVATRIDDERVRFLLALLQVNGALVELGLSPREIFHLLAVHRVKILHDVPPGSGNAGHSLPPAWLARLGAILESTRTRKWHRLLPPGIETSAMALTEAASDCAQVLVTRSIDETGEDQLQYFSCTFLHELRHFSLNQVGLGLDWEIAGITALCDAWANHIPAGEKARILDRIDQHFFAGR